MYTLYINYIEIVLVLYAGKHCMRPRCILRCFDHHGVFVNSKGKTET